MADITFLPMLAGFLYLAVVLNASSRARGRWTSLSTNLIDDASVAAKPVSNREEAQFSAPKADGRTAAFCVFGAAVRRQLASQSESLSR